MILGEEARRQAAEAQAQHLRDVSAAKYRDEQEVGRRRRTVPVLTSLVGLSALGAAIIVWLTMPASSQVTPTPAPAASTQAAPLSPMQEKALKPKDTFKECANCPEMVVVPAGSFTMGSPTSEPGAFCRRRPTTYGHDCSTICSRPV